MKAPTIGPLYAYTKDAGTYLQEFMYLGQTLIRLQSDLNEYWNKITSTCNTSTQQLFQKAPKQYLTKEDIDTFRKIAIDIFEDNFSKLFDSKDFAQSYGKVLSTQLDFMKHLQKIAEANSRILNLPSRKEVDEILIDIHDLKRAVREIKKNVERLNQDGTRDIITK
jgi:hypothetical protein